MKKNYKKNHRDWNPKHLKVITAIITSIGLNITTILTTNDNLNLDFSPKIEIVNSNLYF